MAGMNNFNEMNPNEIERLCSKIVEAHNQMYNSIRFFDSVIGEMSNYQSSNRDQELIQRLRYSSAEIKKHLEVTDYAINYYNKLKGSMQQAVYAPPFGLNSKCL